MTQRLPPLDASAYARLEQRVGRLHLKRRLGIETDHEARVFGQGINFFHIENWYSLHQLIRASLVLTGTLWRGRRNALTPCVRRNDLRFADLPEALHGYTILHISDPHLDINAGMAHALVACVRDLDYDLCVLTGDYRGKTFGPYDTVVDAMRSLRAHLKGEIYGILGNHDTLRMVPEFEDLGVRMLMNEAARIEHRGAGFFIAGIDDPHYYGVDNIERAAQDIPPDQFSVLLAHTPEVYRHAAHADFNVMLCGHTHAGQICLPGGRPLMCNARCPRRFCAGAWTYHDMQGYTSAGSGVSIVDVRFNCPPEVTLHRLVKI